MDPATISMIGKGTAAVGGALSSLGKRNSKNKARKRRIQGIQQALNEYGQGTTDTQGNRFSYTPGQGWGYNLSNAGQAAQNNVNRAIYAASSLGNISPSQAAIQNIGNIYRIMNQNALANQRAATMNALRTGTDVGAITRSFGNQRTNALQQAMLQNMQQGSSLAAQRQAQYLANVDAAQNYMNQIQQNAQQVMNGAALNRANMGLKLAEASAVPKVGGMETLGSIAQGIGQAVGTQGQGMQKNEMFNNLMQTIIDNKGELSPELLQAMLSAYFTTGGSNGII